MELGCPLIVLTFASTLLKFKWLNVEMRHVSTVRRSRKPITLPITNENRVIARVRIKSDGVNKSCETDADTQHASKWAIETKMLCEGSESREKKGMSG